METTTQKSERQQAIDSVLNSSKKPEKKLQNLEPIQQWDAVAYNMIKEELAPKGFKEIERGAWKGNV